MDANDVRPVASLRRRIGGLDVRCGNPGCDVRLTVTRLTTHMADACTKRQVRCAICETWVVSDTLLQHMQEQLPQHVLALADKNATLEMKVRDLERTIQRLQIAAAESKQREAEERNDEEKGVLVSL